MPPSPDTTAVHISSIMPQQDVLMQSRCRWRSSFASGFRAALACTIVGVASIYAPLAIRRHLTFPAFSYVVTVIIVIDATVGSALRAALSAVHATAMGAVPSVLPLWLAHRTGAGESVVATTAVVALSTFAAGEHAVGGGAASSGLGNVVACTALGVVAALLGVLLPCPRLATREVREKKAAYLEVATERVRLLADAFQLICDDQASYCCRRQRQCVAACIMSQADRAALLLRRITSAQGDLQWERMPTLLKRWCSRASWDDDGDEQVQVRPRLHDLIEMPLRGMEMACIQMHKHAPKPNSSSSIIICQTATWLQQATDQVRLALLTKRSCSNIGSSSSSSMEMAKLSAAEHDLLGLEAPEQQLPPLVFLFCMDHHQLIRPNNLLLSCCCCLQTTQTLSMPPKAR
ncbi:hypothetical protein E2562_036869 [Oryza meyeriana var. granulata]|uniref:Uncharacterized protein n=1 Tax=Oryza meyeriana var. granulata TaxID=110450 RepID=A0A6G1CW81_9ORYZ|nr:hypothetical protein E2562_036869 [Oryza meyeriana var. granulata]